MYIPLTPKECISCHEEFLCRESRLEEPICNFCIGDRIDHTECTLNSYMEIFSKNTKYENSAISLISLLDRLEDYEKLMAYKYLWEKQHKNPNGEDGIWWGIGEEK